MVTRAPSFMPVYSVRLTPSPVSASAFNNPMQGRFRYSSGDLAHSPPRICPAGQTPCIDGEVDQPASFTQEGAADFNGRVARMLRSEVRLNVSPCRPHLRQNEMPAADAGIKVIDKLRRGRDSGV